ncbi:Lacrimal proline-rich protein [Macaca mulatta]|uniref:Lacrimal proline-rich protein n=2 Tax=Macaca TaxID=9539 RepID=G7N661_MACMU|nr:Lacrimal proline-rich protein [Macaca mulatta]EHH66081.1 Lacrimal proline-rich protein [Macaca fascicularis]
MLLVLLSVVLLALSSAQSTDNELMHSCPLITHTDVEDSSQSPDQGPQRPPPEGLLPRLPGDSCNQDDGPQQRPPQPGGHHRYPLPLPFQNQQRRPQRTDLHRPLPRLPPVRLEEVPAFFQGDKPPRHLQDQPRW